MLKKKSSQGGRKKTPLDPIKNKLAEFSKSARRNRGNSSYNNGVLDVVDGIEPLISEVNKEIDWKVRQVNNKYKEQFYKGMLWGIPIGILLVKGFVTLFNLAVLP